MPPVGGPMRKVLESKMALYCVRRGRRFGRCRNMVFALGLVAGLVPSGVGAADIEVTIDEAKLIKLPERVATLVIGNPLIADASVQNGGLVVLTGKSFGATNFIALDRSGAVLMERVVEVRGRDDVVVVYKGVNQETYSCAPSCQHRIMPGDVKDYFENTLVQTLTRSTAAQTGGLPQSNNQGGQYGPGGQGGLGSQGGQGAAPQSSGSR